MHHSDVTPILGIMWWVILDAIFDCVIVEYVTLAYMYVFSPYLCSNMK